MVLMFFCAFLVMRLEIFRDIQRYLEISRDIRRRTISNPRFCLKMSVPLPMEMRQTSFLRKLKNEFSIFKSPERDLTIGDVAHARHTENKLSSVLA
jgi:hypothetical protein